MSGGGATADRAAGADRSSSRLRLVLGAAGVLVGLYGAWLLLSRQETGQVLEVAVWVVAGLLLHDVVVSGLELAFGAAAARVLPRAVGGPVGAGAVVLGSVTLMAVPVLGRFGAKQDNLTLLDRDYATGWLVLAALTAAAVLVAVLGRGRERRGPGARGTRG